VDIESSAWGILQILEEDKAIILETPEDGLIHMAWEARMFDLFCTLVINQTADLERQVRDGMSRAELVEAMSDLVGGREIIHKLKGEVSDLPGIANLVHALDQLEAAIAEKGLVWQQG
jgi:hypothetical protein